MFGYTKISNCNAPQAFRQVYVNYYCGVCFALQRNYGFMARFLLNYDVTALSILLKAHKNPQIRRLPCVGLRKQKEYLFKNEIWKKIAGINILWATPFRCM